MAFRIKKLLFLIGWAVLLLYGVPEVCTAEEKNTLFDDVKVTFKFVEAPNFRASDATSPGRISRLHTKWLVIGVEFKPVKPKDDKSPDWLDNMTMDVGVLFKFKNKGKDVWCLFTGTSEFWTIPRDGHKHVAAMFIPPQVLDRYFSSQNPDTFVKVQFGDAKPVYDKRHSESAFEENGKKARMVSGAVLPRNLSPWAIVDVDEYDLLKPAGAAFGAAE